MVVGAICLLLSQNACALNRGAEMARYCTRSKAPTAAAPARALSSEGSACGIERASARTGANGGARSVMREGRGTSDGLRDEKARANEDTCCSR